MPRPKKFMIRSDMEGLSGVVSYAQVTPGSPAYAFGHAMLQAELAAAIDGLRAGGAGEIVIYDEHVAGTNTDISRLPAGVSVICGKPRYRADWRGGLDETFAGMLLLGLHARAGTPGALLAHTYEHDIRNLWLNGVLLGEIGVEAAVAGDAGVPLVLVIADSAGVAEAKALLPGVVGVAVKESREIDGGVCPSPVDTCGWIRTACRQVARRSPPVRPYRLPGPVTLELELGDGPYLRAFRRRFRHAMLASNRVHLTGPTSTEVWARYWEMKLAAIAS